MVDRSRRNVLVGIGAGSAAVALGGLSIVGADQHETDNESGDTDDDGGEEETGRVRVAHLSPDAPNVDVFVDGDAILEDAPFETVSEYLELSAGSYNVQVAPAGEGADAAVLEEDLEVPAADLTVAAIGEVADENQPLELAVFEDDNSDPGDDTARVHAVHASPDAPAVDVVPAGTDDALVEDLAYGDAEYVEVPADTYQLCIFAAGEREGAVRGPLDVEVAGGTVYSAFAVGYAAPDDAPADEPLDVVITVDSEGDDDAGTDGTDDAGTDDADDGADDNATDENETGTGDDMDDNATGDDATDDNETNGSDGDGY